MWPIQKELFTLSPIIEHDGETARRCNDEFLCSLVGVAATRRSRWDVVKVVNPLDGKWYVTIAFDKGKIPPLIRDFWQIENAARVFQRLYGLYGLNRDMRRIVSHWYTP